MKNIIVHEEIESGKTLLLAFKQIRVLYDEKECQYGKIHTKTNISEQKKEKIANKLLDQTRIPLYSKVEDDEVICYFYYYENAEYSSGLHIIISKKEPFAHVRRYKEVRKELINADKQLQQAKEILKYAICDSIITRYLDVDFAKHFYCDVCEHEVTFDYANEDEIIAVCDFCETSYQVKFEPTIRATIKQIYALERRI